MKKAQGLPMNVIVIAAIALLVLVVIALIFMGRIGGFSKGVAECQNQGGVCLSACGITGYEQYKDEYRPASSACAQASAESPVCCIQTGLP